MCIHRNSISEQSKAVIRQTATSCDPNSRIAVIRMEPGPGQVLGVRVYVTLDLLQVEDCELLKKLINLHIGNRGPAVETVELRESDGLEYTEMIAFRGRGLLQE